MLNEIFFVLLILNIHNSLDAHGKRYCLFWLSTSSTRFNINKWLIYKL